MPSEREFIIKGLILDPVNSSPIVILQDREETTILPIWIGIFEANSIAIELEHIEIPRPMTHDLVKTILDNLSVVMEKVVVTDLRESTYYAEIFLRRGDETIVVDSRPSDALALAVRTGARILVVDGVVQKSRSFAIPDNESYSEEDLRKWLEGLSPEDMGKYEM